MNKTKQGQSLEAFDRIAAREIQHLTNDIPDRRQVIEDLVALMPAGHRLGSELRDFLQSLYCHELQQRELPLMFSQGNK